MDYKKIAESLLYYDDGSSRDPCYEDHERDTCFYCGAFEWLTLNPPIMHPLEHREGCIWVIAKEEFDNG